MPLYKVSGIIVLACVIGCRMDSPELSPASVNQLAVEYRDNASGVESIHLWGVAMNSMYGPAGVKIENRGTDVDIVVYMRLKESPELSIDIPIDRDTDRVFWQGRLIWERKRPSCPRSRNF